MPPALRNVLAVVLGIVAGSVVNMGLVTLGPHVIPPPPGVDMTDTESLAASVHLFEARHFVFPFLAHALGTLVGALVAFLLARSHARRLAFGIGAFFLLGGIAASYMIPAPAWFMALDLLVAYLPMAWLAILIGRRLRSDATPES